MITSKRRAELRAEANGIETTLIVGKGGVSDALVAETEILLEAKELVKGRVLETALLSAREASDELCARTGAEGIQTVGSRFVIYRKSERLAREAQQKAAADKKKPVNPVRVGVQKRRRQRQQEREERNEYFKKAAIEASIERQRKKARGREE